MGLIDSALNFLGVRDTNRTNRGISASNRYFQSRERVLAQEYNTSEREAVQKYETEMANTALQRGMADAKAAGLHAHVAAGTPAATPSVSPGTSSAGPGDSIPMRAPRIDLPDILTAFTSLKQLQQADERIQIDDKRANAEIMKHLSGRDLDIMRKKMLEKGIPAAELGKTAGELMQRLIKMWKDEVEKPTLYKHFE